MRHLLLTAVPSLALALAPVSAVTAKTMLTDPILTQNGHQYACTGVGMHAQNDPRWRSFPLKLVFAQPGGAYLTDFDVTLSGKNGIKIIETYCEAPWFLAKVPPGAYKAKVTSVEGLQKSVDLNVKASGQTQVVVTFNEG